MTNIKQGICIFVNWFYPYPKVGGIEIYSYRLAKGLAEAGMNVFILTRKFKGAKSKEIVGGVPVNRISIFGKGILASFILMVLSSWFLIRHRKIFSSIHVNLVSSHAITACLIGKLLKKRVLMTVGGGGLIGDIQTSKKTLIGRIKLNIIKNNISTALCFSNEIQNELISLGVPETKLRKIGSGVETALYKPVSEEGKILIKRELGLSEVPIVTYLGRTEPEKGLEVLLKAWQGVVENTKTNSLLLICGTGALKTELQEMAARLCISERVIFTGKVTSSVLGLSPYSGGEISEKVITDSGVKDAVKYYLASDIFVLPSLSEGLSTVILEAMSCGLPVLASRISANEEIIKDGENGLLVAPDDAGKLEKSLILLLNDAGMRKKLGTSARNTVTERFSVEKMIKSHLEVYN